MTTGKSSLDYDVGSAPIRSDMFGENTIYIGDLTPRHQEALKIFVAKFKAGAKLHGDLKPSKPWTKDKLEELVDTNFYTIFELLDVMEGENATSD